ncbi:cytochrome P450 [Mycena leptocephala]|nr:cytochrome P450 [Mycena leptocephala]
MGPGLTTNPYHVLAIRGSLTRNLGRCFPEVRDEIVHAFDDVLALEGKEWKGLLVLPSMMQIIARTTNRLFVGLPLCREQEYLDLNINYTFNLFIRGQIIGLLPRFVKPVLGPLISPRKSSIRHVLKFLGRYSTNAEGAERNAPALAARLLMANFAAIHTSTMGLTSALYDLTTYPEYILPLREEAERVIGEEDDSFIRESQRLGGMPTRLKVVAKGFSFSDGTTIPYGAFLNVPGKATHYDEGARSVFNRQMVSTAQDHLVFGHGKHACPGRFFAATELKAMLAHILINYDVKAETEGVRPPDQWLGVATYPNRQGKNLIRKRE